MSRLTPTRLASTTLVVRDHVDGWQVLMLRRSLSASFMPGAYVFPGGAVDPLDGSDAAQAHAVAALRECFEECGLWLGLAQPVDAQVLAEARRRLLAGSVSMHEVAAEFGLPLRPAVLARWSHWVTPIDLPKRFDTWFFVVLAPPDQAPKVDAGETTAWVWVRPAEALAQHGEGQLQVEFATLRTLESLAPFDGADALMRRARAACVVPTIHPRVTRTHQGERRVLTPEHEAYAEVMLLDPEGTGGALSTLQAGAAVPLAPGVLRLVAPHSGGAARPAVNSYLVGMNGEFVVIDPGPFDESHIDALLRASGGRLHAVMCTHGLVDQSLATARLIERTGAARVQQLADGACFEWPGGKLVAIQTLGSTPDAVTWWLASAQMLFGGGRLESARWLRRRLPGLVCRAPRHGFLMCVSRSAQAPALG